MSKLSNKLGRPKNSKNKNTEVVRNSFQLLVQNNLEQLQNDLNEMTPVQRFQSIVSLSKFILPQLNSIDFNSDNRNLFKPIEIHFKSNEDE